jgi:hypothetical protein
VSPESLSSANQEKEAKGATKEAIYDAYVTNKIVSYRTYYYNSWEM